MQNTEPKKGMARLLELAFIKKGLSFSACALAVVSVAASFAPFIAIYYIIRELCVPSMAAGAYDTVYLRKLGWIAAASAIGAIALNWAALLCSHAAAFTTIYRLKLDFTRRIAALPLGFHTANATGKLRKVLDENIEKLEGFIAHQLPDIAGSAAMPVIALVILFLFDWRFGLACIAPLLASYLIQSLAFASKPAQTFLKKYQDSLDDMNSAAVEYVRGISVVKAFNQTIYSFRKFHESIKAYGTFVVNYTRSFESCWVAFMVIIHHVFVFLLPLVILLASRESDYARFALSALFYIIFSFSLVMPFTKLIYVSEGGRQIAEGIERMDKLLAAPSLSEPAVPKTANEYSIAFNGVSFYYEGAAAPYAPARERSCATPTAGAPAPATPPPALLNVSFTAKQGEITALVGPSGGGKSTIAHLIPRFYDVVAGEITIGGVDIRGMANEYLMSLVSFVFQDVFLFKQSVASNILVGNQNASREQMIAAAKAAQCHEFIEKLPQGYETVIGAKNVHLSGGERQRIVIARAMLKNAPILVLDEATAFADPQNERLIQCAFEELMKDKTVIIIAHRLSTVRGADKIIVLEKGAVVETGKHDDLIEAGGRYSKMWEQYSAALDWRLGKR